MKKKIKSKELGKIVIEVTCECGNKCDVTVMNSMRAARERYQGPAESSKDN